jgi:hypothetical protein
MANKVAEEGARRARMYEVGCLTIMEIAEVNAGMLKLQRWRLRQEFE